MSSEEKQEKGFTRRTFIKGAALGTVGIATAGILAGCGDDQTGAPGSRRVRVKAFPVS